MTTSELNTELNLEACRTQDPLWILRTGSLLAQRGEAPPATAAFQDLLHAAQDQAEGCRSLAPMAVQREIEAIIMSRGAALGLQWLRDTGAMGIWLPELEATVNFSQEAGRRHKDVWEHTKQVVYQAVPRQAVRWAALEGGWLRRLGVGLIALAFQQVADLAVGFGLRGMTLQDQLANFSSPPGWIYAFTLIAFAVAPLVAYLRAPGASSTRG